MTRPLLHAEIAPALAGRSHFISKKFERDETVQPAGLGPVDNTHRPPGVTIVGYNLYRSTISSGPFVKLASNLTSLRYGDGLVGSGKIYFYVVTAIDQAGRESRISNEARASIP